MQPFNGDKMLRRKLKSQKQHFVLLANWKEHISSKVLQGAGQINFINLE